MMTTKATLLTVVLAGLASAGELTISGTRFLMDGKPFPYTGISFFNAAHNDAFNRSSAERKEWLSRPAIASALAKNPKTPPEIAVRSLEYVPLETLRQMAKGIGAPPHVVQAARKKVIAS